MCKKCVYLAFFYLATHKPLLYPCRHVIYVCFHAATMMLFSGDNVSYFKE